MEYSRIDTTVKHYIKSRNEVRIKVENAGSEEDIIHGFINEDVFNGVLKKVLETLALPNVEKCDVSRLSLVIKDFITKHWYEIEPDVDGGSCGGGYVLSFEDVSRGMEVSFPCQEAIKLVEQCAYIVRDLIKGYCQAHGDTVCQLCENEALIGGMVLTSPVEAEEGVNGLSRRMVLGTPVETREDLNECQAEQLEYGCTDTQCINDCSPTKTHQENFMATRDSLDHRTSKLNSTVCLQVDIPSDQVASEQEEKNNAELSETDEEGAHCASDVDDQENSSNSHGSHSPSSSTEDASSEESTEPRETDEEDTESVGSVESGCNRALSQLGPHCEHDRIDKPTEADSSSDSDVEFVRVASQETFEDYPKYKEEMLRKYEIFLKYWHNNTVTKAHEVANCALIYHVFKGDDIKHKLFESVEDGWKWASENIELMEPDYPFILVKKFKGAPNSSNVGVEDTPKFSVVIKDPSNRLEPLDVQAAVDTAADDSTMGFNSERVKRRLHSVREIEHDLKPVVYGYINVEGEDIEHICEIDVDPDSPWNGVGIRELKALNEDTLESIIDRLRQFFSTAQN